jgi:hypothetical protein
MELSLPAGNSFDVDIDGSSGTISVLLPEQAGAASAPVHNTTKSCCPTIFSCRPTIRAPSAMVKSAPAGVASTTACAPSTA